MPVPLAAESPGAGVSAAGPASGSWRRRRRGVLRLGGRLAAPVLRWVAGWRGGGTFAVLTYHRVGGPEDPFFTGVPVERFRRQAHHLKRHWSLLPVGELLRRAEDGSLPRRAVGVTFDDSYRSVYELAWPILREVGASATVFVPTGPLREGRPLWYDRVLHALKSTSSPRLPELGAEGLDGLPLPADAARREATAARLLSWLRRLDEGEREARVGTLERVLEPLPWSREPALAMADIETLRRATAEGLEVGSHSVSHPIFSGLPRRRVRRELQESRRDLEAWLQRPVELFAYPNGRAGDFDSTTEEELRRAGYRYAFTTEPGINGAATLTRPYRLRRNDATGTEAVALGLRLARLGLTARSGPGSGGRG